MTKTCPICLRDFSPNHQDSPDAQTRARERHRFKTRIFCGSTCQGIGQTRDPARKAKTRAGASSYARRHCAKTPCVRCGETRMSEVHHKNRDHLDNRPENLERLCKWCHAKEHSPEYKAAAPLSWARRMANAADTPR